MSTTHTPGPVAVNNGRMGWALRWPDGATSYMPDENAARMFAAAPELLAACEALVAIELPKKPGRRCGYCNFIHCDTSKCPVALASAAIAKAKGPS